MKSSFRIALCSVITALSILFMLMTVILPVAAYSCVMLTGLCTALIIEEIDGRYALCSFAAVSIISALLVPDKESVVLYIVFFGYYPVLHDFLSKKINNTVSRIIEYLVFNAACFISFFTSIYVLSVPKDSFMIGDLYLPWVILIMANILFFLYDYTLKVMVKVYRIKFKKYLQKMKR